MPRLVILLSASVEKILDRVLENISDFHVSHRAPRLRRSETLSKEESVRLPIAIKSITRFSFYTPFAFLPCLSIGRPNS